MNLDYKYKIYKRKKLSQNPQSRAKCESHRSDISDTTIQSTTATSGDNSQTIKIVTELNNSQNMCTNRPPVLCATDGNTNVTFVKCETCGQRSHCSSARDCSHCGRSERNKRNNSSINDGIISEMKHNKEPPKFSSYPKYVLFGTAKSLPKNIDFYANGIKFNFVAPNNHLMIPYADISDFNYCVDRQQPTMFIKPTEISNRNIKSPIIFEEESLNSFKFDINSGDVRQHFIIAVFNDQLSNSFVDTLKNMMQMNNISVNIKALSVDETKLMLIGFQIPNNFERTTVATQTRLKVLSSNDTQTDSVMRTDMCTQTDDSYYSCDCGRRCDTVANTNNSSFATPVQQFKTSAPLSQPICSTQPSSSSSPNTSRCRSIGCQIPEFITIDDEDINKSDSNYIINNENNGFSDQNHRLNENFINARINNDDSDSSDSNSSDSSGNNSFDSSDSNSDNSRSSNSSDSSGSNTVVESINMISSEINQKIDQIPKQQKFINYTQYVMFGTYKCEPKTTEFDSVSIKFTNVSPNTLGVRFTYDIMIPYVEMSDFYYCVDPQQPSIFIGPNKESNNKIQNHLYLGVESKNGLKIDINSRNVCEHFIIAVFNEQLSNGFVDELKKMMRMSNATVIIKDIPLDNAKLMLQRVREYKPVNYNCFGRKVSSKVINSRLTGIRNAIKPYDVNASPTKSKHTTEQTLSKSGDDKNK